MNLFRDRSAWVLGAVLGLLAGSRAGAAAFVYSFNAAWTDGRPGASTPVALEIRTSDGRPGEVFLTIRAPDLAPGVRLKQVSFNLDPQVNARALHLSRVETQGSFHHPKLAMGSNRFQATGNHLFDFSLVFPSVPGRTDPFNRGDSVTFQITGDPDLSAASFGFEQNGEWLEGKGPNALARFAGSPSAMARLTGVSRTSKRDALLYPEDGLKPIPEPRAWGLLGLGLVVVILRRARWLNARAGSSRDPA